MMKLIYFFDHYIKPFSMKGKKYANPANTGIIGNGISCIREYDVNFWFYTKGNKSIVFDSGHLNFKYIDKELEKIGINGKDIENVFLTHADVDHAGGVDINGVNIFPDAMVYLGRKEEFYLNNTTYRFQRLHIKINNCVKIKNGYTLLDDMQTVMDGDIKVQAIHIPGHTLGHLCYIVDDKILISGDCLAINQNGGYSFFEFFTQYPEMNKKSLRRLKELISQKKIEMVCTGHSGYYTDLTSLFSHIDESAKFSKRGPFDKDAPYNLFQ
jgi:hydroxyacylglutathione hydrolase